MHVNYIYTSKSSNLQTETETTPGNDLPTAEIGRQFSW